jgi:hypothetical protein
VKSIFTPEEFPKLQSDHGASIRHNARTRAGFRRGGPLEPIFRALRIPKGRDRRRLLQILGRMDYIGADNLAAEVASILTCLLPHMNEDPEAAVEERMFDGAVTSVVVRSQNISGIMRRVGEAVVGILLLCVVVIRFWR